MSDEEELAQLGRDAARRVRDAPALDVVIEDAGRQRLAAYYLYTAAISGLIHGDGLTPSEWPAELGEPMDRMGLTRFSPRSVRGLDAELTASEQATRRSSGRRSEFAGLAADLINHGAFGACAGEADSVRVAEAQDREGFDFELLQGEKVLGRCRAEDHWELVAQQLARAPHGEDPLADTDSGREFAKSAGKWLKEHGISSGISKATDLAVGVYPLGTTIGVGTRLVRSRIQTGQQEADALHRLGEVLRHLHAEADGELSRARR